MMYGAHDADRTRDLVLTKDVLYQLSYMGSRHDFVKIHLFFDVSHKQVSRKIGAGDGI